MLAILSVLNSSLIPSLFMRFDRFHDSIFSASGINLEQVSVIDGDEILSSAAVPACRGSDMLLPFMITFSTRGQPLERLMLVWSFRCVLLQNKSPRAFG